MAAYKLESNVELTSRIVEMIEGESVEVLEEILCLLHYHTATKAGAADGNQSLNEIIQKGVVLVES